jgi:ELWxxDGT repeat protein
LSRGAAIVDGFPYSLAGPQPDEKGLTMKGSARRLAGAGLTTALSIVLFLVVPADAIELVADINQGTVSRPTYSGSLKMDLPQGSLLPMQESTHGIELWFSDNTPQGTHLLKDINPGWEGSGFTTFTRLGDVAVFPAGEGLWRSDGTISGTYLLSDIAPATMPVYGYDPSPDVLNGVLYYAADDGATGNELWRTDGTRVGTYQVADLVPGYAGSFPHHFTAAGSNLFFLRQGELWISDGTGAGTQKIVDLNISRCCQAVGNAVFFTANDGVHGTELWRVDADGNNVHMVANINTAPLGGGQDASSDPIFWIPRGDSIIFLAYTPLVPPSGSNSTEFRLFRADASGTGVTELANFGFRGGIGDVINLPAGVMFNLSPASAGDPKELWVTDGTPAGTMPLDMGINYSSQSPTPLNFARGASGEAYFFAHRPPEGPTVFPDKIWRTDGTRAGTRVFADLTTRSENHEIAYLSGRVYFDSGDDGTHSAGDELWSSDGTTAGTYLVRDLGVGIDSSITDLRVVNGKLQFFAMGPSGSRELWASDGTMDGTINLITSNVGSAGNGSSNVTFAGQLGTRAVFTADRGAGNEGHELFATDGTSTGTTVVRGLFAGGPSDARNFLVMNGQILFVANDTNRDRGLWRTDGTSDGTIPLQVIPGAEINEVTLGDANSIMGGVAHFTALPTGGGFRSLWRSDGTSAGTFELPGTIGQSVDILGGNGTHLLYRALHNGTTMRLWSWDGSQALIISAADTLNILSNAGATFDGRVCFRAWDASPQTIDVWCANGLPGDLVRATNFNAPGVSAAALHPLGNRLLVNVPGSGASSGLYVTQGSAAGVVRISAEQIVSARPYGNGQLVFASESGRLMLTDGTSNGTRNLLQGVALPGGLPGSFGVLGGYVVFVVNDATRGAVVWRTDGTPAGTRYLADLDPGTSPAQAGVGQFFTLGDRLLFSGYRTSIGNELWSINATDPNASDEAASATGGTAITVDVLDNDADFDGTLDAATVTIVAQPAHGTATVNATTGAITYTATATHSGVDSLTYRVSDDQARQSNVATISFQVTAGSAPPATPPTPPPSSGGSSSGGGGGGALGLELSGLLALALWAGCRRRRHGIG